MPVNEPRRPVTWEEAIAIARQIAQEAQDERSALVEREAAIFDAIAGPEVSA